MTAQNLPVFGLPGSWGRIDLATEESVSRTVRSLVERRIGRADEFAQTRAQFREHLTKAATLARESGGREFHFAYEIAPGIPFSATLVLTVPDIELSGAGALGPAELSKQLGETLLGSGLINDAASRVDTNDIRAIRSDYRRTVPAAGEIPEHEIIQADYWIAASFPARIAMMSFSTVFVAQRDLVVQLFDAIIGTVSWPRPKRTTQPALHADE